MSSEVTGRGAGRSIEERLARRFAAELAQAESDYGHIAWRVQPRRRRTRLAPTVFVAIAVIAAIVGLQVGPWRASLGPNATGNGPSASGGIVFGTDGVPSSIGGERVYRPAEASAALDVHPTILLTGVQGLRLYPSCPIPARPSPMNSAELSLVGNFCAPLPALTLGGVDVTIGDLGPTLPTSHLVVIRAHKDDPLAEQCPHPESCRQTIVAEALVWESDRVWVEKGNDGMPTAIGGVPVSRSMCGSGDCLIAGVLERDGAGWKVGGVAFTPSEEAGIATLAGVSPAPRSPSEWASLEGTRVVISTTVLTSSPWTYGAALVWTESGGLL